MNNSPPRMVNYFAVVNDLPKEFGDVELISVHCRRSDAEAILDRYKGIARDSYSHQYVKIVRRKLNLDAKDNQS